jgi:hypothetical protein
MKIRNVMLIAAGALVSVASAGIASIHFGLAHAGSRRPDLTGEISAAVRISRPPFRGEQLRLGMNRVDVERIMGRPAAIETVAGSTIEVLNYRAGTEEPLSTRLTFGNGKLRAVVLDVADVRDRPAFTSGVIPGLNRAGVIRALGQPEEDYEETVKGLKVEHMLFESPTHSLASVFLASGRVVGVSAGRDVPPEFTSVILPMPPSTPTGGLPIERIRLGMTPTTVTTICGEATWSVHSSFKGLPVLGLAYATSHGDIVARFTFVAGALTEMSK